MIENREVYAWIDRVKLRGMGGLLRALLDALAPLGPLGAQVLWFAQPVSGWFGWRALVGDLAEVLEEPGGIDRLRQYLDEDPLDDPADQTHP